jgi:hypothetical protein
LPSRRHFGALLGAGLLVYALAEATFFVSHGDLQATPSGPGNRTAVAAAGGTALVLVAASGLLASAVLVRGLRRSVFSVLIALVCTAGVVIINCFATFWIAAADKQHSVFADLRGHVPSLTSGTVLILDGVCPFIGPAVVFDGADLSGALAALYQDATIRGDLVTPRLAVTDDGFDMDTYGYAQRYGYPDMLLYNMAQQRTYRFADADAARAYFARYNPDQTSGCAGGVQGFGVSVV